MLSGLEIFNEVSKGNIVISDFDTKRLNPNSYNVRLHNKLLVYEMPDDDCCLDMKKPNPTKELIIPEEGLVLRPNVLYLGRTKEYTETKCFVPKIDGRSSIGRLGMFIHVTAGFGDVGFKGYWTLEIFCVHPIRIYPNIEIGQLYYEPIHGDYTTYQYKGKYQNNDDIQPSMLYKDWS